MRTPIVPLAAWFAVFAPCAIAAPANDNFAAAAAISAASGTTAAVAPATATLEPGEPRHASETGGHSIWYRFTPVVADRFVFHTNSSSFDTLLAAYTGGVVNALTEVASDDDSGSGTASRIEFTARPANPVSLAIDGYEGAAGNAAMAWSPVALTNDSFAAAVAVSGGQGFANGFNFRATGEAGEPNSGTSVWYRWAAPANANGAISVVSQDMASFVGVYTGTAVGALTQLATSTAAAGIEAVVNFTAVAGTVYRIQVKGGDGGTGEFTLSYGVTGGANLPMLPDIVSVASAADQFMYGWHLDQAKIPGRTLLRVTTATANTGSGPLELRGSTANPAVYQRIYRGNGTWYEQLAGTFSFHPTHDHLHFDGWLQFHLRAVTAGNGVGDIIAAGDKTSFAILDLQEHDLALPGAPQNNVYTGEGLTQGISVGWRDVYDSSLDDQWIDVTNVPPGTYWLESIVDPDDRVEESDETNNTTRILITYAGTAPPNNSFANATVLTGTTAATSGRNYSATKESGEPAHAGNTGGRSVWYRWTAPATGPAVITTAGSSFDTLLAVYTGTSVSGLTSVAFSDDDGASTISRVTFNAVAGTTYRIAVDGKGGAAGTVEIAINPAANDQFANAVTLSGSAGTTGGSTRSSTAQTGEPAHAGSAASTSIWYFWNATLTGDAVFNTEASTFNTRLAVYTGSGIGALTPVASSISNGLNSPATALFHVNSGTGYYIAVDGAEGVVKLNWQAAAAIAPYVITQPPTGNHPQGMNLNIPAAIGGSPLLTYQWRFNGDPLSDGGKYAGVHTPVLTVNKLEFADSGAYTLLGTNPSGTVVTNPANIIVLTNPRTASVTDSQGDIGGSVFAPVTFNATGSEHTLQFTLTYDTAVLGDGQIIPGHDAEDAAVTLDRSLEASGRLGVTVTLAGNGVFAAGLHEVLTAQFRISPSAVADSVAILAFGDTPVVKQSLGLAGTVLPVVFDPGNIILSAVQAGITSAPAGAGGASLTVRGLRGETYQLLQSADMTNWMVVDSAVIGSSGTVTFTRPAAGPRTFYKAAPAP